jgi:DNA helicase II / ATP-dependent DNA helicase PcrA
MIDLLGGRARMQQLRATKDAEDRYPEAMQRLGMLLAGSAAPTQAESIERLLERVSLSNSEGAEADPHRVNLLTLHSTKGLEFSRVYIVGVEDAQVPGEKELATHQKSAIEEARRLLYVGMTRARDRLVLTRVAQRFGVPGGGNQFLREMGLEPTA